MPIKSAVQKFKAQPVEVQIKSLDTTAFVLPPTAKEAEEMDAALKKVDDPDDPLSLFAYFAGIICQYYVDENGVPEYEGNEDDIEELMELTTDALVELVAIIKEPRIREAGKKLAAKKK